MRVKFNVDMQGCMVWQDPQCDWRLYTTGGYWLTGNDLYGGSGDESIRWNGRQLVPIGLLPFLRDESPLSSSFLSPKELELHPR
jgi:hypothetical protein